MITPAFVLVASALAASATKSLTVKVSAPDAVSHVDNFAVKTTIVNTGDELVKLLKDPRTPLSTWATNTFDVTNDAGARPDFTGVAVRYIPSKIASSGNAEHFTVLAPGASVEISHEVGRYYNFTATNSGKYKFEPVNLFNAVEKDGSLTQIVAKTESASTHLSGGLVSLKGLSPSSIGGGIDERFAPGGIAKRASYTGCSTTRQSQVSSAISSSKTLAQRSVSHLNSNPSGSSLQTTWFGTFSSSRYSALKSAFTTLQTVPSGWTYNCNTCADETDTYAYVYPSSYGTVYLCGLFWNVPSTGSGSRADTIIHEGSHFTQVKGTQDYTYGESSCKSLAKSSPSQASNNADNLAFFSDYV